MKKGDLIISKIPNGVFLFPHLKKNEWVAEEVMRYRWNSGFGLVLEHLMPGQIPLDLIPTSWVRILTPTGVGWCMANKVDVID